MKRQAIPGDEALTVRPLEARTRARAMEMFPGAMMHLSAGFGPFSAMYSFFDEVNSGRQNAWIAEVEEQLIGMVVLSIESQIVARLTYLHVAGDSPEHQRAANALAEVAIRDAWEGGYLKLVVHARLPTDHVVAYMHKLGFEYARTQSSSSSRVVEFYRNLYEPPQIASSGVAEI